MRKPKVALGSLGGTIAMTDRTGRGLEPTLGAVGLLEALPDLAQAATIEPETLALLPGASLGYKELLSALGWAQEAVDAGATGVVLTQGTDTLEESAYLLDLYWDRSAPLVVTAAMRAAERPGSDGTGNLAASVAVAVNGRSRGRGVLVVLNDEVHAAARVSKRDSTALGAFQSSVFGPLGRLVEGEPAYGNQAPRHPPLAWPLPVSREPRVALLTTHLADAGELLALVADGGYDAVVLAALGVGHVSQGVAEVVGKAADRMPVVFATRTGAGPTARRTYAFIGSETDLISRGALPAGWLSPVQARLLLWALLRQGCAPALIEHEFTLRGDLHNDDAAT